MDHQVTLTEMLDAREKRAFRQQKLLEKYHCTTICFTMNIAGPVKNNPLILRGFQLGKRLLEERMGALKIKPIYFEESNEVTGNEAFYVLDREPLMIKRITSDIEDGSDLGRLFDMDVLRADGQKVDRTELGLRPRSCLICGKSAKECSRSRIHSVLELQHRTKQLLIEAIEETDAQDAANSGSHKDMDIFTFMNSASALFPYFETCVKIGKQTSNLPAAVTFTRLRSAGKKAEADMFSATKGINTHKGAIFSIGILCSALGRLSRNQWKMPEIILKECAVIAEGLVDSDFSNLTKENAVTSGQKLYLQYHITGIRGQIEAGLPAVQYAGLPILKKGLANGLNMNDAGCAALLTLMVSTTDTNLIARSDITTQQKTVQTIKEILIQTPYPDKQILEQLDQIFIGKNLSPGGSADLLAICYFLYFLESEA